MTPTIDPATECAEEIYAVRDYIYGSSTRKLAELKIAEIIRRHMGDGMDKLFANALKRIEPRVPQPPNAITWEVGNDLLTLLQDEVVAIRSAIDASHKK